jgi:ABC-type nickel/cobalt efflux system permease component RcnA
MKSKLKKISIIIILLFAVYWLLFTALDVQAEYKLEIDYPEIGGVSPTGGLTDYIRYLYLFGLGLVGITALGALVYGGFMYMLSGTITSKDEAKKWIWGAISGLILALAAYLILNTINPDLLKLKEPTLPEVEIPASTGETGVTQTPNTISYVYDASAEAYNTREKCENIGQSMCGERLIGVIFGGGICRITCNRE